MLAGESDGPLTITQWTSAGSAMPASSVAARTAVATFRIWPIRPMSSGRIGSEEDRPITRPGALGTAPASTSTHSRVIAVTCGEITP